jgi:hypothetical protein
MFFSISPTTAAVLSLRTASHAGSPDANREGAD